MKASKFLSLNWFDLAKAFLVALIVLILNFTQETFIPALNISPETKVFFITSIGYLVKNFFTKPTNVVK